ncbi:polyamine-modulated factor 1-like isoform X2 [Linepithema humile]|uniref:polyamine-modulated factor 1-like isoform X2 n=1 Tax=Linepithema humile TaxID=83485 RepID=UPI0006237EC5|nr:PREDICTED: uncharacterized protein LOC105678000 isoform X2 [Linepithema humile]
MKVGEDEFLEIFTFLKADPKATKLHKVMIKDLYSSMMNDFEEIFNEVSLENALTKISRLSEESALLPKEDAWRPPGDVTSHMKSLDADTMKKAIEELKKEVNEMEKGNEALKKKVMEGRARICTLNENIRRHLNNAPVILGRLKKTYDQLMTSFEIIENE